MELIKTIGVFLEAKTGIGIVGWATIVGVIVGVVVAIRHWPKPKPPTVALKVDVTPPPLEQETETAEDEPKTGSEEVDAFFVPLTQNLLLEHEEPWLEKIKDKLAGGGKAVVGQAAVSGGGGIGKTAMALEYAYRFSGDYPDGVFWLKADLGLGEAIWELAGRMAGRGMELGIKPGQSDEDYVRALASFLNQKEKSLVILDNVENPNLPGKLVLTSSDLLATSRRSGLPLPPIDMHLPEPEEALDIFLSYANRPNADLSPDELAAAIKICERVDNLPLALEIMGMTARDSALVDLEAGVDDVISTEAITQAKGETSVVLALNLAEQKYNHPKAKEALVYLGYLHPEEIEAGLVAEVMKVEEKEATDALRSLARFSVVKPRPEGGYAIHRLTQEVAQGMDDKQAAGQAVAGCLDGQVQATRKDGKYQRAYPLIPHLVHLADLAREETPESDFPARPLVASWAEYLYWAGRSAIAEQMLQTCLARVKRSKGDKDPDYAVLLNNLTLMLKEQGQYEEAEDLYRQALEIDEQTIGKNHPNYAIDLNNLAEVLGVQGKYQEPEKLYRQALAIAEKTIGKEHPHYAGGLNNLALVLQAQGKYEEVEGLFRQALKIGEQTIGKEHPSYAIRLGNLAGVLESQGRHDEAEPMRRQVLDIHRRSLGEDHPHIAIGLNNLAVVLRAQGKYEEAEKHYRQALKIDEKAVGREHPQTATHLHNLGLLLAGQGRLAEAEPLLAEALEICLKFLGPDHPDTQNTQAALDRLRAKLK